MNFFEKISFIKEKLHLQRESVKNAVKNQNKERYLASDIKQLYFGPLTLAFIVVMKITD